MESAGQDEIAVSCLVVAVEEPRCVPSAAAGALARIELGIANRSGMLDRRDHGWAKIIGLQGESGCELCADDWRRPRNDA